MEGTVANKKRKTNPLPVLWEVVQLPGHSAPIIDHPKGVITLIEEGITEWDRDGMTMGAELTFDVPNTITETPAVVRLGDALWDVHNASIPQPSGRHTHYQLGLLVSRRAEQFAIGSGDDLHFLGTDVSSTTDSTATLNLDGINQLVDDRHKNDWSVSANKAAEAIQQLASALSGPSQAFNQIGQQMISGFLGGFDARMKEIKDEAEERLAEVRANQERANEIGLEITNQYFSVQNRREQYCYFVVTSDYKVISFESKEHLNCFLVEQLDNQAYGIILIHSYAEWFGSSTAARIYDIIKAIENYKRGAKC